MNYVQVLFEGADKPPQRIATHGKCKANGRGSCVASDAKYTGVTRRKPGPGTIQDNFVLLPRFGLRRYDSGHVGD